MIWFWESKGREAVEMMGEETDEPASHGWFLVH